MNPQFDEIAVLKQRVLGIERENRRFKTAAGAGVGLLAILLLSGQSWRQDGVLQARELSLTDAAGKTCMKLSVDEHGRPQIALSDSRGMRRLSIALSDKGEPSVGFARDNGALGLLLDLPDNGGPTVELRQRTGEPRATLELLEDGTPKLHLVDDEGLGGILALADANRSSLQIWDRRGGLRALLAAHRDRSAEITLTDTRLNAIGLVSDERSGTTGFSLTDMTGPGGPRASLELKADGSLGFRAMDRNRVERASLVLQPDGTSAWSEHGK